MSRVPLTSDRIYVILKQDVERGRFAAGLTLPIGELAEDLGTSVQPVRDVLARLVGERLLTPHPRAGFQVPLLSRRDLRNLVDWHAHLLRLVLRERRPGWSMPDMMPRLDALDITNPADVAETAGAVFAAIASCSENIEHVEAVRSANARLHSFWARDSASSSSVNELRTVASATMSGSQSAIKKAIWAYQRRQQRRVRNVLA